MKYQKYHVGIVPDEISNKWLTNLKYHIKCIFPDFSIFSDYYYIHHGETHLLVFYDEVKIENEEHLLSLILKYNIQPYNYHYINPILLIKDFDGRSISF